MAAYHFTAKPVSRSKGQSAVHTAAYNARTQLYDEREGRSTKDYSKFGDALFSGIFAPKGAPEWAQDREVLWNRAEAAENRVDAQTARNVEFSLPYELSPEQRERLVKDFARETFARRGMVADVSIHAPDDESDPRNVHVHCLLTLRRIEGEEFSKTKCRDWNSKDELNEWREKWAHMGARALDRAGLEIEAARFRHGHQPIAEQRAAALERGDGDFAASLDREATRHKGPTATAMERKGLDPDRTAGDREARAAEAAIRETEAELAVARSEAARSEDGDERRERRAARTAARLYDHAGMAGQQRDALRHLAERQRQAAQREQEPEPSPAVPPSPLPQAETRAADTAGKDAPSEPDQSAGYRERMTESGRAPPSGGERTR